MPVIPLPPFIAPGGPVPEILDRARPDETVRASELLRRNGFPRHVLREGVAVMGAESNYSTTVDNNICCIGLMQINYKVHKGKYGIPADEGEAKKWLQNADNNVRVAYQIWKGAGNTFVTDWEARSNGAYRKYLGQDPMITVSGKSLADIPGEILGGVADAATAPLDVLDSIGQVGKALLDKDTYFRLGKGALGFYLVAIGVAGAVFVVARKAANSNAGKQVIGTATDVLPAGKAAKLSKATKVVK